LKSTVSPLSHALKAIGDPWSFLIHQEAFFGVRRFDDFQ
jgi:DNA-binding HxlR family transcriptional regulator